MRRSASLYSSWSRFASRTREQVAAATPTSKSPVTIYTLPPAPPNLAAAGDDPGTGETHRRTDSPKRASTLGAGFKLLGEPVELLVPRLVFFFLPLSLQPPHFVPRIADNGGGFGGTKARRVLAARGFGGRTALAGLGFLIGLPCESAGT